MANEKIMNTRIQLKYDSYENWQKSSVVLKAGEIAIAHLGPANKDGSTHASGQHPVLIKVGDNSHTFAQLPWLSGLAADVYAWAKKETPDWSDFPALPIEVIDNGTGKFITNVEYADNIITISRDDAVNTLAVTDDDVVIGSVDKEKGDVTLDLKHKEYGKAGSTTDADSDATAAGASVTIKVPNLTVDKYGHTEFNGETSHTITIPGEVAVGDGNITIAAGTGLTDGGSFNVNQDTDNTITLNHQAKPTTGTAESATEGSGRTYVTEVLVDELGHIAGVKTATETVVNTAHTHTAGDGLKLTGDGGVDGVVDYSLNLALKLENGNIILHDKDNAAKVIATLDAAELLEDSYLNDVEIVGNELQFTWKMDDGSTKTDKVDLTHLVDVYTGENEGTVKVEVDNYKISAEVIDGTLVDKHIAANAAIAETKLAQGVQDALALARTALQSVEHPDYTDEFAGKKDKQTAVENKITNAAHVLTSLTQNTNGDIAYEVKELTPEDIGAQPAGDYKTKQTATIEQGSATQTITSIEQNENGEVSVVYSDIAFPDISNKKDKQADVVIGPENKKYINSISQNANGEITATLKQPSAYDVEECATAKNSSNEDVPCLIFYCGTASDLI